MSERLTFVGGSAGNAGAVDSQRKCPAGFVSTSVGSSVSERITYVGGSVGSAGAVGSPPVSAGALPWRHMMLSISQSFAFAPAGVVPVDRSSECSRADLSIPGSIGSFMARGFLDSGSALTAISVGLLQRMSSHLQLPLV